MSSPEVPAAVAPTAGTPGCWVHGSSGLRAGYSVIVNQETLLPLRQVPEFGGCSQGAKGCCTLALRCMAPEQQRRTRRMEEVRKKQRKDEKKKGGGGGGGGGGSGAPVVKQRKDLVVSLSLDSVQ